MAGARLIALRVLRRPDGAAPGSAAVPVPAAGLIVGRAPECDLVLDDPLRLVSRQHARLQVSEGGVATLRCISATLPIAVNGAPLPPGGECPAQPGDHLRIGGFELEIEAVESAVSEPLPPIEAQKPALSKPAEPPRPPPPLAEDRRRSEDAVPLTTAAGALAEVPAARSRIDQWFDLENVADPWAPGSPLPAAPPAILAPSSGVAAPVVVPTFSAPAQATPARSPSVAVPAAVPVPAPADAPVSRPRRASPAKEDPLIRAFFDGAGLTPAANSPVAADAAWMRHLGALLRASTEGTLALLRSRAVTKKSIRAEGTRIVPRENNPLKFAPDASEALALLIDPQRAYGFLDPLGAVRDAHNDLLVHQLAMVAGMRAAAYELIARMGPDAIEAEQGPATGLARWMPSLREAALWRRHRQHHAHVMTHLDDDFEAVFGREFLLAYEAQSRLAAASRAAEGPPGNSA